MNTILITGANRGIGFEIARQMGKLSWRVFVGARNRERGEEAVEMLREQGSSADFIEMDVCSIESIRTAFREVRAKCSRLDVLINNAGISMREDRDILTADAEMIAGILQTNAVGPLLVVQVFRSLLGRGSRVIMVSSSGGSMTDPVGGWSPVYCISKTLLNGITRQVDYALKPEGITVSAMCPGWVRTGMGGRSAPRDVESGAETAVWLATDPGPHPGGAFWRDKKVIPW